jgi:hypothetical protein
MSQESIVMANNLEINDKLRFVAFCSLGNQVSMNVFNYRVLDLTGTVTDVACVDRFDELVGDDLTGYKAFMATSTIYWGIKLSLYGRDPMPLPVTAKANTGVGTNGANSGPKVACGLTAWLTEFTGPKNRGRTFWPFLGSSYFNPAGDLTAGAIAQLGTLSTSISPVITVGSGGNVAHLQHIIQDKVIALSRDITTHTVRTSVASMHKRGDYGKANAEPPI